MKESVSKKNNSEQSKSNIPVSEFKEVWDLVIPILNNWAMFSHIHGEKLSKNDSEKLQKWYAFLRKYGVEQQK